MNIATALEALARKALVNAVCPNCQRPFGPGLVLQRGAEAGPPQVRCPHCGVVSAERVLSMTPGATAAGLTASWEDRNNPTGPQPRPDGTPILLTPLPRGGLRVTIPPRRPKGAWARTLMPVLIGLFMLTLLFTQAPMALSEMASGPPLPLLLMLVLVGGFAAAGWRSWREDQRRAGTALRVELGARVLTLHWTGADGSTQQQESLPLAAITAIRRRRLNTRAGPRGNRHAFAVIEIGLRGDRGTGSGTGNPVFGHGLSAAEQRWIVWELRQALAALTNGAGSGAGTAHQAAPGLGTQPR